jgi:hypothetical protein
VPIYWLIFSGWLPVVPAGAAGCLQRPALRLLPAHRSWLPVGSHVGSFLQYMCRCTEPAAGSSRSEGLASCSSESLSSSVGVGWFPAGQHWKEVKHDQYVTWLAFWRDPVNTKEYK